MSEPTHHEQHIVSPRIYGIIFGLLMLCTALTVGASYLELGTFNAVVALGIAIFKATIVILFFMHVKYSSKLTKVAVAAGFFTFFVLLAMTLTDYMSRAWGRW